jgi:hypothetical protein
MSETGEIKIEDVDERFLLYVEINQEKKRIELYKCPVPGCHFTTQLGPGAVRMHTIIVQEKSLLKDESGEYAWAQTGISRDDQEGFDHEAHIDYFKENEALTLADVMELARTDTRPYSEREV